MLPQGNLIQRPFQIDGGATKQRSTSPKIFQLFTMQRLDRQRHLHVLFLGASLRDISFVLTGNGISSFFWLDTWLLSQPLSMAFPHLFSHSTNTSIRVCHVMLNGLLASLRD